MRSGGVTRGRMITKSVSRTGREMQGQERTTSALGQKGAFGSSEVRLSMGNRIIQEEWDDRGR